MILDYGLKMSPETVLKIADTEEWLLQPELKAIKDGLIYGETDGPFSGYKYRGYLNQQGERQGVGILRFDDGDKRIREFHENKQHGTQITILPDGEIR